MSNPWANQEDLRRELIRQGYTPDHAAAFAAARFAPRKAVRPPKARTAPVPTPDMPAAPKRRRLSPEGRAALQASAARMRERKAAKRVNRNA